MYALAGSAEDRTARILAARCWSERLNTDLIEECEAFGPACLPTPMARLLDLDYCPGECGTPTGPGATKAGMLSKLPEPYRKYAGPVLLGVLVLGGAFVLQYRQAARR